MARKPTRASAAKPKRPPEIKPAQWRKLAPATQKRYAAFYRNHPGQPLYRARGKGAAEHVTRRAKLDARIEALAERQHHRGQRYGSRSAAEIAASYRAVIRDHGVGAFGAIERKIAANHARWTQHGRPRATDKGALGLTPAEYLPDDFDWSDYGGEDSEFFYH